MIDLYKNFKYKIGDKVWARCDGHPVQCEITDRHFSSLGARAYLVALPVAEGVPKLQARLYDCDVFAAKEELCDKQIKQYEEEIEKLEQSLAIAKNQKARWEAFKEEAE